MALAEEYPFFYRVLPAKDPGFSGAFPGLGRDLTRSHEM